MQYLAATQTGQRLVLRSQRNNGFIICPDCLREMREPPDRVSFEELYLLTEDAALAADKDILHYGCCMGYRSEECIKRAGTVFRDHEKYTRYL